MYLVSFDHLGALDELWFCMNCTKESIPFFSLDISKLRKLFGHPCTKSKSLKEKLGIPHCRICRNNNHVKSAIRCTQCQHLKQKVLKKWGNASK